MKKEMQIIVEKLTVLKSLEEAKQAYFTRYNASKKELTKEINRCLAIVEGRESEPLFDDDVGGQAMVSVASRDWTEEEEGRRAKKRGKADE